MEGYNYRVIIKPYGDNTKEEYLVKFLFLPEDDKKIPKDCRGCALFPMNDETYIFQTSYPIPQEYRDSLSNFGITLVDFVKGSHNKASKPSGKAVEASRRVHVNK